VFEVEAPNPGCSSVRADSAAPAAQGISGGTGAPASGGCPGASSGIADETPTEVRRGRPVRPKGTRIEVDGARTRGGRLPELPPDVAAQILILIQNRAREWIERGPGYPPGGCTLSKAARPILLAGFCRLPASDPVFESERKSESYAQAGLVVLVRLTAPLRERIAALVGIIREQKLQHVVMPLMAADFAWLTGHLYAPASRFKRIAG
jgi:hypothetical protein